MTPTLSLIELGLKTCIQAMNVSNGYYYTWGSVNEIDKSKMVYPAANIELVQEECTDTQDGVWAETYMLEATYNIRVWTRLESQVNAPYWEIDAELNKALDDLKKCFGINYTVSGNCDIVFYRGMTRETYQSGDVFIPKSMLTRWTVRYTADRTEPSRSSE